MNSLGGVNSPKIPYEEDPSQAILAYQNSALSSTNNLNCGRETAAARPPTETEIEFIFQDEVRDADLTTNVTITGATETEVTPAPTSSAPVTPRPTNKLLGGRKQS